MFGRQAVAPRDLGTTGLAAVEHAALGHEFRPRGTMDCAIDAASAKQRRICRVDDGVNAQRGDVGNDDFQPRLADLAGETAQAEAAALTVTPLSVKKLLQLTGLEHLADDVAATDKLALDVELRDGRPVGISP